MASLTSDAGQPQVFKPAPSAGWAWLAGLLVLTALPLLFVFTPEARAEDPTGAWIGLAIMVPLVAFLGATLASLPAMRYEIGPDALVLRCGPLLRYRIAYTEITDVRRRDLMPSLWSSMRLPGLALWGVPYADEGTIYMCATRMARAVLVVSTARRRYGMTPAEADRFVGALLARVPGAGR